MNKKNACFIYKSCVEFTQCEREIIYPMYKIIIVVIRSFITCEFYTIMNRKNACFIYKSCVEFTQCEREVIYPMYKIIIVVIRSVGNLHFKLPIQLGSAKEVPY